MTTGHSRTKTMVMNSTKSQPNRAVRSSSGRLCHPARALSTLKPRQRLGEHMQRPGAPSNERPQDGHPRACINYRLLVLCRMSSCGGVVGRAKTERLAAYQPHRPSLSRALIHGWLSFAHGNPLESSRSQLGLNDHCPCSVPTDGGGPSRCLQACHNNHQVPLTRGAPDRALPRRSEPAAVVSKMTTCA